MNNKTQIYNKINKTKKLELDKKGLEAIRNSLIHYKDNNLFRDDYKNYLDDLSNKVLMLFDI